MKAPKIQDNPKKKAEAKPTSMTTNSGIAKANAEEKDRAIRYYENPDYLIKNKIGRTGYWNEFQKYLQDYTLPSGEKFIQNEQVNKGATNEFSDKALQDYRASLVKKYGEGHPNVDRLSITPEDVKQVQTYYNQGDPNFKVDARIGGETSQLRYPTLTKADIKVAEGTYAPVMYGKKQYLAPADKYNSGNFTNDLIPYNPSLDTKIDPNALKTLGTYTTQSTNQEQPKAKGGIVQKLVEGGKVRGDKNGDGFVDAKEQDSLNTQDKTKNAVGGALGGVGTAYYNSKEPTSQQDATRNAGMAAVSQAGPIGGVIGGVAAIGDKVGAPIKARSEQLDASGNLVNASKSKRNAIGGSLFSPTKALAYRSETGNWGDVTGGAYNKSIEDKAKGQLNQVNIANKNAKMQQLIEARNNQEENPMLQNAYDTSGATFDANHNLVLANGQQFDPNRPQMNKGGVVGKVKNMYSEGGEIKGKGGPKDDKIEAEVKEDSFVVPAENAELAKGIRKLYLKAPIKKANLKQEEGEPVKLSNGEHLFTPEENEYLESIGIELEDLAPNAEEGNEKRDGGKVKPSKDEIDSNKKWAEDYSNAVYNSESSSEKTSGKKDFNKSDIIMKYRSHSAPDDIKYSTDNINKLRNGLKAYDEKVKGYALGGEVISEDTVDPAKELAKIEAERKAIDAIKAKKEADRTAAEKANLQKFILEAKSKNQADKTKEWEKKYNDSKVKLDALNKSYEETVKSFDTQGGVTKKDRAIGVAGTKSGEYQRKTKEELLKKIQEAKAEHDNAKRTYDYVKSGKTYVAPKAETKTETPKVETKTATTEVKPTATTPTKPSLKAPKVSVPSTSKFVAPALVDNGEEVIVPGDNLSPNERAIANANLDKATADANTLNKSLPQTVDTTTPASAKRRGWADVIGNVDPTAFVGIGQTALGLNSLRGQVRPVDKAVIDPTYNAAVNRSLQDAKFGLTPEQKFLATQDIQNSLNDAKAIGLNTAGGSGVQAFNTNRAAINDAWKAKLGLKQADTEARMAKQKYADVMAADRANILASNRRQAFTDAMSTFQQKQKAGSELIGAGLANTIGAYRFNQDQKAMEKANAERNAWTRNI